MMATQTESPIDHQTFRFEVALSFAGDNKRDLIRAVAEILRDQLGEDKVFFDEWFEAEIAGPDAHVILQKIYGNSSRLVVAWVCQRYGDKPWTQEEWRAIQDLERGLRDAGDGNVKRMRFLPLRFGEGEIDGLFNTAIVPEVGSRQPQEIAKLILKRLELARKGQSDSSSISAETVRANTKRLESALKVSLSAYKDQPKVFIDPRLTKVRDSAGEENVLHELIATPFSTLVLAHPEFGQTCLCHYLCLQAYKEGGMWVSIDAEQTKTRKVVAAINGQLDLFGGKISQPDCIVIDHWNPDVIDHANMLQCLESEFPDSPIVLMVKYTQPTYQSNFAFSKLQRDYQSLHLQPLPRNQVRKLVTKYCEEKAIQTSDTYVTKIVKDLAALNVHRTPLNCLTLLRVFEKDHNEEIINRTKLIKTLLFILFTDTDSFNYASSKPDVEDCEYILGKFCKSLVKNGTTMFDRREFRSTLDTFCQDELISVEVNVVIDILESNNILVRSGDSLMFKHRYWIFYFAASYMLHDPEFAGYILRDRQYVNFPEIIEFYTGIDGRRSDAVEVLIADTKALVETVDRKIGIQTDFNPYEGMFWSPSDQMIETMRAEVTQKVEVSNLPDEIKDRHADRSYDSRAPYDQTIRNFLHEYSVISMVQAVRAASRALRNSKYVRPELKQELIRCIIRGWESYARVFFVLTPTLAQSGRATFDGFGLVLDEGFEGTYQKKYKDILLVGPLNIVGFLKDDLSSGKIGPLVGSLLSNNDVGILQKQFVAYFLIKERPAGWVQLVFDYMNLLHRNSFYLWNLSTAIKSELQLGFATTEEKRMLKQLREVVVAKHIEGRKTSSKQKKLPSRQAVSEKNKLPIDKIRKASSNAAKRNAKGKYPSR